ncbi:MAG: C10 family peptidase [Paludibacteraceae bacterium]|nr:C10 family peptidase [Paludibacteraceae bacterium]
MKKTSTLMIVFVLLFCGIIRMQAGVITPALAKEYASQFTAQKQVTKMEAAVVFDAKDKTGHPYLYAVNLPEQGGFVLVSGDDRFRTILGYSSIGFDEESMPENMRAWLQDYIDEMRYLESIDYQPTLRRTHTEKAPIAPLITSTWGQDSPYNDACPLDDGKRSATGCVATAMSQLVNYHIQHYGAPKATIAEIEGYISKDRQLKVDTIPAGTAFPDGSLLLDTYGEEASEAQKAAVAQLMLICGTSVHMNYTNDGSGANSDLVPDVLISKFGFDNTTRMISRFDYTYAGWQDVIYAELAAARPVYLRASSSGGGHAFLTDGYKDGLFHINWGWYGSANDYFALSVLNPDDEGQIGASNSSDGYTIGQKAIIGTQINSGETWTAPICLSTRNYRVEGQKVKFLAYNETGETRSFETAVGFIDEAGAITLIEKTMKTYTDMENESGKNASRTIPTNIDLANTTKKLSPISREVDTETWYTSVNTDVYYFIAEYDAEGVPTLTAHPNFQLTASEITIPTSKFITDAQTVKCLITNTGDEYYGTLYLFASTDETKGDYASILGVTILPDSTQEICYAWYPQELGTYNLWIASDKYGEDVLSTTSVTITKDPAYIGKSMAILYCSFEGMDRSSEQIDPETGVRTYDLYSDSIIGKVYVGNLTADTIKLSFGILFDEYDETTGTYIKDTYTKTYKNRTFAPFSYKTYTITPREKEIGKTYRMRLYRTDTNPKEDLDMHYIFHLRSKPEPMGIDNGERLKVKGERKILRDGQLFIIRDGRMYDVMGRVIGDW